MAGLMTKQLTQPGVEKHLVLWRQVAGKPSHPGAMLVLRQTSASTPSPQATRRSTSSAPGPDKPLCSRGGRGVFSNF